ncbi:hypothetical protein [Desulfitobacterium sp. AusDCA]|uniref:hypothetical protein n=1 Tax=Desulfitobacterium sp. AusDCA TaxID=3240383 RepID=UPI003DA774AF
MQENNVFCQGSQYYKKLYFVWYFDDDEGYGIDVLGEKVLEEGIPNEENGSLFCSVVNWSFGKGTEARDLRRSWGEYVADMTKENGSTIPPDLVCLRLRFSPEDNQLKGDLQEIKKLLLGKAKNLM